MRKELKNFDWHVYGLSLNDFDYTISFIDQIIHCRSNEIEGTVSDIIVTDEKGEEIDKTNDAYSEVESDFRYYHYLDNFNIYHFGLWRLQGIFEGILKQNFFPNKMLNGLKIKLEEVTKQEYSIDRADYEELLEWAKLRNALSHFPPEQYRPTWLLREDLIEYYDLVKKVTTDLNNQLTK